MSLYGMQKFLYHLNRDARVQQRLHGRRFAGDREQATAGLHPGAYPIGQCIHRASQHDHVEAFAAFEPGKRLGDLDARIADTGRGQPRTRAGCEFRMLLDAHHIAGECGDAGGQEAGAGADFEHTMSGFDRQRLQDAAFDDRLQHDLAVAQRQFGIDEGHRAKAFRHEILAAHAGEHVEYARIEHVPCAHLVVDHVGARQFEIRRHRQSAAQEKRAESIGSSRMAGNLPCGAARRARSAGSHRGTPVTRRSRR
jgi:hypothetical protein